jgi:septum site-determining protein MinD
MVNRGDMMAIEDVTEILAIDIIGVVPDDESIITSTNRGEPAVLDPNSRAGQAYNDITRRIMGEDVPFMDLEVKDGFFDRVKKLFKP